jgi:hypothetical protein
MAKPVAEATMGDVGAAATEKQSTEEKLSQGEPGPPLRQFSWSYWLILTTIVATLAFYFIRRVGQANAEASAPLSLLDARFGFTPSDVSNVFRVLGPKGRSIYQEINRVDFILAPIVFREYFLNTFPASSRRSDTVREVLANTYIFGDVLENICIAIMLKAYPKTLDAIAWIGCAGNIVKNLGVFATTMSVLYEAYVWVRNRIRERKMKTQ